jgi:fructokinase
MKRERLIAIGEALIDMTPADVGCAFEDVSAFFPAVGGAPANVAAAYARLGAHARLLTQLGCDPFGDKIIAALRRIGVDTSYVTRTERANTALAFVSLTEHGERTFSFYRKPSADMLYSGEDLSGDCFRDAFALTFSSVSLGEFPMREAHRRAIALAREEGAMIVFDPNLRLPLWQDPRDLADAVSAFLPEADLLKISDDELPFITGTKKIEEALPALFKTAKAVLYTCGASGAFAYTRGGGAAFAPATAHCAVDTTGAGDGFLGAFLYRLMECGATRDTLAELDHGTLKSALAFAARFSGISVTRRGAIPSYPTREEVGE